MDIHNIHIYQYIYIYIYINIYIYIYIHVYVYRHPLAFAAYMATPLSFAVPPWRQPRGKLMFS